MRVAVGGVMQETNTFCVVRSTLRDFAPHIRRGEEIVSVFAGTRTPIGGFLEAARREGFDVVPTYFANATPSGLTDAQTFETLLAELSNRLRAARPFDGVLLALHGAMAADGSLDADGTIARRVREAIGSEIPLSIEIDLHGNVSQELVDEVDILVGYDTYPHVDPYDRGIEAGTLLSRLLRGTIRPVLAIAKPPLLMVPQAQFTSQFPMSAVMAEAQRLEAQPGMLAVTVAGGFCYADVPHAGLTVVAMADGDRAPAQAAASRVADLAWSHREAFTIRNLSVEEGVKRAVRAPRGPVLIVDVGDNIGGGGPGDGTVILDALLKARVSGAVVTMADPVAVAGAVEAGAGAAITLSVGGRVDPRHGSPVQISGRVRRMTDGRYVNKGTYMTGAVVEMGRTAVLETDGIQLILTERKTPPFDLEQLRSVGIEPTEQGIIVVKAAIAWRAAYEPIAAEILEVDTPGVTSTDLTSFPFANLRRPIYPLDHDARWPAERQP